VVVCGNPTRNTGAFYEATFGNQAHRWRARSIDSRTCKFPNHRLHEQWIQDHGIDSDYVRTRVLGLPPKTSEFQLIGRDLVQGAQKRKVQPLADDPLIAGVDIPDGGSAWFVVRFGWIERQAGTRCATTDSDRWCRIDRSMTVAKLAQLLHDEHPDTRITAMFVDTAFGAPIVERLCAHGYDKVFEVSFGGKSPDPDYANMRTWMWGKEMLEWLERGAIDPVDKKLASDLTGPEFKRRVGGDGALVVESKDDMRARGIPSPDDGDALALTFARRVPPPNRGNYETSHAKRDGYDWMR
jgi:hypothetical protein